MYTRGLPALVSLFLLVPGCFVMDLGSGTCSQCEADAPDERERDEELFAACTAAEAGAAACGTGGDFSCDSSARIGNSQLTQYYQCLASSGCGGWSCELPTSDLGSRVCSKLHACGWSCSEQALNLEGALLQEDLYWAAISCIQKDCDAAVTCYANWRDALTG